MPRFKHIEELVRPQAKACARDGCAMPGEHKAPLHRDQPGHYQWLCLDHVQEFNRQWDYFSSMTQEEIERFQWEASMGHRPTWKINSADAKTHNPQRLRDAFQYFMGDGYEAASSAIPPARPAAPKDRKAMADLNLGHPFTEDELKANYKKLAKQYHPDRNPGNSAAEEKFKQITASYHYLIARVGEFSVE